MDKIIVNFQPFTLKQKVSIYQNDSCIRTVEVSQDRISDVVAGFSKEYGITNVNLIGSETYLSKFKENILKATSYEKEKYNVEIISRR